MFHLAKFGTFGPQGTDCNCAIERSRGEQSEPTSQAKVIKLFVKEGQGKLSKKQTKSAQGDLNLDPEFPQPHLKRERRGMFFPSLNT